MPSVPLPRVMNHGATMVHHKAAAPAPLLPSPAWVYSCAMRPSPGASTARAISWRVPRGTTSACPARSWSGSCLGCPSSADRWAPWWAVFCRTVSPRCAERKRERSRPLQYFRGIADKQRYLLPLPSLYCRLLVESIIYREKYGYC